MILAVDKNWRGKGIGEIMINHAYEQIKVKIKYNNRIKKEKNIFCLAKLIFFQNG